MKNPFNRNLYIEDISATALFKAKSLADTWPEKAPEFLEYMRPFIKNEKEWLAHHEKIIAREKNKKSKAAPCKKCGGSGKLFSYRHVNGGLCYKCGGKGY